MLLGWPTAREAHAQQAEEAFAALSSANFNTIRQGVEVLVASGHPRAAAVIVALQSGRLFARGDKALFIKTDDGGFLDAIAGSPAPDVVASALKPVRVNNTVRSAIDAGLGALRLFAPDTATRSQAAEAVFRSRDPAALPALTRALAKETDPSVKTRMEQAQAAARLFATDTAEADRLAAVAVLRARGDIEARSLLSSLSGQPPAVAEASETAITAIDRVLQLWSVVQSVYYGLSLGSVLLLAAAGLAITFGVMGVINMAHGEMVMIGAYTTFVVQEAIRTSAPGLFGWSLAIALPLAFLVAGGIGVAIERGVIRFLYGRPLETLLATWGVSLVLQQAVRTAFGPTNREVGSPAFMTGAFEIGGLVITWNRLFIVLFAAAVFIALLLALKHTRLGLHMRAVTQNRRMAGSMGIPTGRVDALTFGLGSGIAGLAGVALSQIDNVSPNLGQSYIIDSFLVVVFGGVGNLWGTLVGALTLGIANKLLEPWAGAVLGKILLLIFIIVFIQKRPRGLFALKGRAVEA